MSNKLDSWFEKIPGGYYKANDYIPNVKPVKQSQNRHKDDRRDYDRRERQRRYSNDYEYDRHERRRYDDGRREDYHSRRSIDGRSGLSNRHDQRRSYDYDDQRPSSFDDPRAYNQPPPDRRTYNEAVKNGDDRSISPLNTGGEYPANDQPPQAPLNEKSAPAYTGYVPYAHIYGSGNENQRPQQSFSPPPASSIGSVQPSSMNQMTTSRRNPMSVDGSVNNGLITPMNDFSPRAPFQHEYPDGAQEWPEDRLPYRGRDRSRDRSDSRSHSYDSRPSRARSERRNGDEKRERGKSMSKLKSTFDASQRGVGYGAVGAIAGGLIGSGAGSGPGATATGAVLGGVLANMFEARERRKENARNVEFAKDTEMTSRREKRDRERRESTSSS